MNYRNQKNGAQTGPLIFSVPAYGFVMALYLDWLGTSRRTASFAQEVEPVDPARSKSLSPMR